MTIYIGTNLDDVINAFLIDPNQIAEIFGLDGNDTLTGGNLNDIINGGAGRDLIDGGLGADTMTGGGGTFGDTFVVDNIGDRVIADGIGVPTGSSSALGVNTIISSINLDLLNDPVVFSGNVYNLVLTGQAIVGRGNNLTNYIAGNSKNNILSGAGGTDYLYGFGGADTLDGGDGNDFLDGGAGADTFITSLGADTYYVDNAADVVTGSLGGAHKVISTVSYNLSSSALGVRDLILSGTASINATGTNVANTLQGNNSNNRLTGLDGNDYLYGNGGNDILTGGRGNDQLAGGAGLDRFSFSGVSTFSELGVDSILDFSSGDRIELSRAIFTAFSPVASSVLPANQFATVANDQLVSTSAAAIVYSAGSSRLFYNPDGITPGLAGGGAFAKFQTTPLLASSSFSLAS
jgi:Ca2+-binding RTX toxin-like protein